MRSAVTSGDTTGGGPCRGAAGTLRREVNARQRSRPKRREAWNSSSASRRGEILRPTDHSK